MNADSLFIEIYNNRNSWLMVYNSWLLITWKNPTKIIIGIPFFRQDRVRSLRSIQRHNLGTLGYAAYKIKRTLSIQMVYKSIKIRYPQILGLLKDFKVSFKIFFYFFTSVCGISYYQSSWKTANNNFNSFPTFWNAKCILS